MTTDNVLFILVAVATLIMTVSTLIQILLMKADMRKIESISETTRHLQMMMQSFASSMAVSMATQATIVRMLQSALTTEYRSLDGNLAAGSMEELLEKLRQNGINPISSNDPGFKKFLDDLKNETDGEERDGGDGGLGG